MVEKTNYERLLEDYQSLARKCEGLERIAQEYLAAVQEARAAAFANFSISRDRGETLIAWQLKLDQLDATERRIKATCAHLSQGGVEKS